MSSYRDLVMSHGPLVYWRFQETSGLVAADETGAYPATYGADAQVNYQVVGQPYFRGDRCAYLPRTAAGNIRSQSTALGAFSTSTPFTAELWFRQFGSGNQPLLSKAGYPTLNSGWSIQLVNSNTLRVELFTSYTRMAFRDCNTFPNDGLWHHLVMTHDGTGVYTGLNGYVDGRAVAWTSGQDYNGYVPSDNIVNTTDPIRLSGCQPPQTGGATGDFAVADVAIYERMLSPAEILSHAQWAPSLVARYSDADAGYIRSVSRPAKNLRNITSSTSTRRGKRRKINPGVN